MIFAYGSGKIDVCRYLCLCVYMHVLGGRVEGRA